MKLRAGALAAATALAAAGLLALPSHPAASAPRTNCWIEHALHVAPDPVALGQDVVVTLGATAECRAEMENHVVIVVDGSESMDSEPGRRLREVARLLGDYLLSGSFNRSAVGVVTFDRAARRLVPLAHDRAAFASAMRRLDARPGTRIDLGLAMARTVLHAGRTPPGGPRFAEVVILFSPGRRSARCDVAVAEAGKLWAENVLVLSTCLHLDCEPGCARRLASSPRYFWTIGLGDPSQDSLFRWSHPIGSAGWAITATVGDGFAYVAGSARPAPTFSIDDAELHWVRPYDSTGAVSVTLRARALGTGVRPAIVAAEGVVTDALGGWTPWRFDVVPVAVSTPAPTLCPATPAGFPAYLPALPGGRP